MPTKPLHSKPQAKSTPASKKEAGSAPAVKGEKEVKPVKARKTLSLIDEPEDGAPKKKRGGAPVPASAFAPLGVKARKPDAAEPAAAPEPPKKTLAEAKREALSIYDEDAQKEEKKSRRTDADHGASILPPISLFKKDEEDALAALLPKKEDSAPIPPDEETGDPKVIHIKPPIIVKDLIERMGLKAFVVMKDLLELKVYAKQDTAIEPDIAAKICEKHGFVFEREKREKGGGVHKVEEVIEPPPAPTEEEEVKEEMELRAPIITFMGHVDHGKTSLLDAIRKTKVVSGEAGGITQHIGAYSVVHGGRPITFIDTPGHAAFSEMRARGANVTDIVVLVVAADDGFMPQTEEALSHAKAAGVTMMVAINKCDLPTANVMRVKQQLQEHDLMPVEWGGSTEVIEVSATKGTGLDSLLETMSLQAEVLELKANPKASMRATVIESRMDPGRGPTATVIVQSGTLKVGEPFICGPYWGKVRTLINDVGQNIKEVRPGMPAELVGFSGLPNVGQEVIEMENERSAKRLSDERLEEIRLKKLAAPRRTSLETLFANIEEGEKKNLRVVLKTDVQGSLEAIQKMFGEIKSGKVEIEILHAAAGPISEGDILLASASDAIVIGFNVKIESTAVSVAKRETVQVKLFSIIYELVDQVKEAMLGLLDPETREKSLGHARIKQVFRLTRGIVAGCVVTDGRIERKARARVIRGGQAVFDGHMDTLRRFRDEVPEVRNGLECGIRVVGYSEYQEDDIIECYQLEKFAQAL
ncbi:MAG TPA: translation initiation factor IF-2 [Verrucomicrobiaceae bacterium]